MSGVAAAAAAAAERAARDSYGRLVALLAYRWRDLAAAEDALADAFAAALVTWPQQGVPASPEAWLMTAAKRQLLQAARHRRVEQDPRVTALLEEEPVAPDAPGAGSAASLPDDRLKLMFVCAHPALPEAVHAPLMLQAVLGLEAATIAEAFLVSPAAMAQRLVRAKAKIRDAGLRFEEPEARELPARLAAVLEAIYGAYAIGANTARLSGDAAALPPALSGLADEALYLAQLVAGLLPEQPEALGLLALLLYCQARKPAQFDAAGCFVPLTQQDTRLWQRGMLQDAEAHLWRASRWRQPGVFQIEAAIQSAHCQRAFTGQTPWGAVARLYAVLVQHFPSTGACIGHAVALAESGDVPAGLAALAALVGPSGQSAGVADAAEAINAAQFAQPLKGTALASHQPFWVALAHLHSLAGGALHSERAAQAWQRAIGLTEDPRVRAHLVGRLQAATQG